MEKSLQQKLQEELNCAGFEHTLFHYEKMLKEFNSYGFDNRTCISNVKLILENVISEVKRLNSLYDSKNLKNKFQISIEIETENGVSKKYVKVADTITYKSETSTLFNTTDNNLLEAVRRTILEMEQEGNLNDVDYHNEIN